MSGTIKGQSPLLLGIAASLFFAVTFIVNKAMAQQGGSWIWSASLRFFWMFPFFLAIVLYNKNLWPLLYSIRADIWNWLLWSTLGFGVFYAPLTYASAYSPAWLLASTWQLTIVAGMAVSPFVNGKRQQKQIPARLFLFSGIILSGIFIMHVGHAGSISTTELWSGIVPVAIAAFAYPLGNRKMMQLTKGRLDVYQRILGMLISSLPFWLLLSGYEVAFGSGLPAPGQYVHSFVVALFSGFFATILFFRATELAGSETQLAGVEATQSAEVIFTMIGEAMLLSSALPDAYGFCGIALVITGMVLHSLKGKTYSASLQDNLQNATVKQ